jgi:hypothetical protein
MNDTAVSDKAVNANALRAGYEQLRSDALGSGGGPYRGFGFALLVREGLAAWVLACRESVPASQRPAQSSGSPQASPPAGLRAELTMILAAMALGERRMTT